MPGARNFVDPEWEQVMLERGYKKTRKTSRGFTGFLGRHSNEAALSPSGSQDKNPLSPSDSGVISSSPVCCSPSGGSCELEIDEPYGRQRSHTFTSGTWTVGKILQRKGSCREAREGIRCPDTPPKSATDGPVQPSPESFRVKTYLRNSLRAKAGKGGERERAQSVSKSWFGSSSRSSASSSASCNTPTLIASPAADSGEAVFSFVPKANVKRSHSLQPRQRVNLRSTGDVREAVKAPLPVQGSEPAKAVVTRDLDSSDNIIFGQLSSAGKTLSPLNSDANFVVNLRMDSELAERTRQLAPPAKVDDDSDNRVDRSAMDLDLRLDQNSASRVPKQSTGCDASPACPSKQLPLQTSKSLPTPSPVDSPLDSRELCNSPEGAPNGADIASHVMIRRTSSVGNNSGSRRGSTDISISCSRLSCGGLGSNKKLQFSLHSLDSFKPRSEPVDLSSWSSLSTQQACFRLKHELAEIRENDYNLLAKLIKLRSDIDDVRETQTSAESSSQMTSFSLFNIQPIAPRSARNRNAIKTRASTAEISTAPCGVTSEFSTLQSNLKPLALSVIAAGRPVDTGVKAPPHIKEFFAKPADLASRLGQMMSQSSTSSLSSRRLSSDMDDVDTLYSCSMDSLLTSPPQSPYALNGPQSSSDTSSTTDSESIPPECEDIEPLSDISVSTGENTPTSVQSRQSSLTVMGTPKCWLSIAEESNNSNTDEDDDRPILDMDDIIITHEKRISISSLPSFNSSQRGSMPLCLDESSLPRSFSMLASPLPTSRSFSAYIDIDDSMNNELSPSAESCVPASCPSPTGSSSMVNLNMNAESTEIPSRALSIERAQSIARLRAQQLQGKSDTDITSLVTGAGDESSTKLGTPDRERSKSGIGDVLNKLSRISSIRREPPSSSLKRTTSTRPIAATKSEIRRRGTVSRSSSSTKITSPGIEHEDLPSSPSNFSYSLRQRRRVSCPVESEGQYRPREQRVSEPRNISLPSQHGPMLTRQSLSLPQSTSLLDEDSTSLGTKRLSFETSRLSIRRLKRNKSTKET